MRQLDAQSLPQVEDVYVCEYKYKTLPQIVLYTSPDRTNILSSHPAAFTQNTFLSNESATLKPGDEVSRMNASDSSNDSTLSDVSGERKVDSRAFAAKGASSGPPASGPKSLAPPVVGSSAKGKGWLQVPGAEQSFSDTALGESFHRIHKSQKVEGVLFEAFKEIAFDEADTYVRPKEKKAPKIVRFFPSAVVAFIHAILLVLRMFASVLLVSMDVGGGVLKRTSNFVYQVDKRTREVCSWPHLYLRIKSKEKNGTTIEDDMALYQEYMNLWASVCTVVVDVTCGILLCFTLSVHSKEVIKIVHGLSQVMHSDVLMGQIQWLMTLPAGIKLNPFLNSRLGNVVIFLLRVWKHFTNFVEPLEPLLVTLAAMSGLFGASMLIAASSDILSVMTTHIDWIHTAFMRLYNVMLSALSSLFKLFRGKKWNVLRERVDSCHFDMEQLMVGTVVFTLVFFLFPTLAVYYIFFSFVRLIVTIAQACLWSWLAFFNFFPFFHIIVFMFTPNKLPTNVYFEVLQPRSVRVLEKRDVGTASTASLVEYENRSSSLMASESIGTTYLAIKVSHLCLFLSVSKNR